MKHKCDWQVARNCKKCMATHTHDNYPLDCPICDLPTCMGCADHDDSFGWAHALCLNGNNLHLPENEDLKNKFAIN
jgi:hypothetical protein